MTEKLTESQAKILRKILKIHELRLKLNDHAQAAEIHEDDFDAVKRVRNRLKEEKDRLNKKLDAKETGLIKKLLG